MRFQLFFPFFANRKKASQPTNQLGQGPKKASLSLCLSRSLPIPVPAARLLSSFLLSPFVFVRCERARRSSAPLPAAIGILISSYTSSSSSSFCGFARLPPFPSTKQCCNQPGFTQQYDHHRCVITPPPLSRQSCFIMTGLDVEKVESSI